MRLLDFDDGFTTPNAPADSDIATQAELDAHLNDTTAAHAASAVSNTPSGNLVATDVQGALDELQGDIDTNAAAIAATHGTPAGGTAGQVLKKVSGTDYDYIWDNVAGGGGGSLQWVEDSATALPDLDYHQRVYRFQSGAGQALYALVAVPSSYQAGSPISIKLPIYSKDTASTTMLLQSTATLIRSGTDAMSSTTNQRVSTNTAINIGAATVDIPQLVTLDLTDASGAVNGVAVSPNDLLLVQIARGTDTSTQDIYALVYAAQEAFQ